MSEGIILKSYVFLFRTVTTLRGTTHVFPISPYGGSVGLRTHTSQRVVNRLSRFHRSAGLDDQLVTLGNSSSGRNSPVLLSGSPSNARTAETATLFPYPNPRLPPYPHPTVVCPLVQLRSSFMGAHLPQAPSTTLGGSRKVSESDDGSGGASVVRVVCCFAPPRGAAPLASHVPMSVAGPGARERLQRRMAESLYVMTCATGSLVEYGLEPKLAAGIPREKACDKSAIDLDVISSAQWLLHRPLIPSVELAPPLTPTVLSFITNGCDSFDQKKESPSPVLAANKETQDAWLAQVFRTALKKLFFCVRL